MERVLTTTGVLLINTGTAEAPTEEAIRAYLAEFMLDPVLFKTPMFIWKRIVAHAILPHRPARTQWRYRAIWTSEGSCIKISAVMTLRRSIIRSTGRQSHTPWRTVNVRKAL